MELFVPFWGKTGGDTGGGGEISFPPNGIGGGALGLGGAIGFEPIGFTGGIELTDGGCGEAQLADGV